VNIRHNWKPFYAAWRQVFTYSISYCEDNIKCDSASSAPKCPLNNGVSIVQKLVVKLSNTSTTFWQQVEKKKWAYRMHPLSLRVSAMVFNATFYNISIISFSQNLGWRNNLYLSVILFFCLVLFCCFFVVFFLFVCFLFVLFCFSFLKFYFFCFFNYYFV